MRENYFWRQPVREMLGAQPTHNSLAPARVQAVGVHHHAGWWLFVTIMAVMFFSDRLDAATYYIATNGNDNNPGTLAAPWRNISKANSTLVAGDRVEVRGGIYDDLIQPANSGTSENARITYTSYNGEVVFIRGRTTASSGSTVQASGRSYITISNLDLSGDKYSVFGSSSLIWANNSSYFKLLNCTVTKANYLSDPRLAAGLSSTGIRAEDRERAVNLGNAQFALVENCTIVGWQTAVIAGLSLNTILRSNVFQNNWHSVIDIGNYGATATPVDLYLLIENNHIGGSMISDGIQTGTDNATTVMNRKIVIRNNYFYYNGEDHMDFKGGGEILVEGNVIVGAAGDNDGYAFHAGRDPDTSWTNVTYYSGGISRGSGTISKGVIIRKNVFYDNNYGVALTPSSTVWKCYNNTFAANNRNFQQGWNSTINTVVPHKSVGSLNSAGSAFINNISIDHMNCEVQRDPGNPSMTLDYNLYANATPGGLRFAQSPTGMNANDPMSVHTIYMSLATWTNYLNTQSNLKGRDVHSKVGNPQFVNVPAYPNLYFNFKRVAPGTTPSYMPIITLNDRTTWFPHDFRLASNSPAIDAGTFLTTTTNAGSGAVVPVVDANYFTDGFGAVPGDIVQIGGSVVQVTAVNYTTSTLTVTPSVTWTNGAGVSLPYSGSKPDIGAFEYTALISSEPAAPTNLTAMLVFSNQINLSWTDNSTNETQFRIERKVGGGSYGFLTNRPALASSGATGNYSDTNLNAGVTYIYRVRADGPNGNDSAWSSEVSTNTPGGGGALTNVHEAELLVIAGTSAGDPTENFAESNASGGTNSLFTANAVGDFITYTVNLPVAGDCNVRVMLNKAANRGRCNLYIDGNAMAQGAERDLYNASGYAYEEVDQGNVTFTNAGSHTFRFQVSGKHASASAYKLAFDYLNLIGSNPAPLEPPAVTGVEVNGNNFVLTFTTDSGGVYEVQRTEELMPPTWIPVVTNIFGNGGTIQITDTNALNRPRTFYRVTRGM